MKNFDLIEFTKNATKDLPLLRRLLIHLTGTKVLRVAAAPKGIKISSNPAFLDFKRNDKRIRISRSHFAYSMDIINSFDFYFDAVRPILLEGLDTVDYSTPRYHDVYGYDKHPIFFPSFSEPLLTTNQYLDFAQLQASSVAIDLGAYSGLTSIVFKEIVGSLGRVVAVDADEQNLLALKRNFSLYERVTGNHIDALSGAVWIHNDGLEFSVEGNMGSSAASIVGKNRGILKKVDSYTLTSIADKFSLRKVDFIKCDIEGAESVILEDAEFFKAHKPRMIVETHFIDGKETTDKCISDLEKYGYTCKKIQQTAVTLPLLECYPPGTR